MQRTAVSRLLPKGALAAAAAAAAVASAGNITEVQPTSSRARQITVYVSLSPGSGGTSRLLSGIRIEEIAPMPIWPTQADVSRAQHKELINLRLIPRSDGGISFGRRVTWSFSHATFEHPSVSSRPAVALEVERIRLPVAQLSLWQPQATAPISGRMAINGEFQVGAIETRSSARPILKFSPQRMTRGVSGARGCTEPMNLQLTCVQEASFRAHECARERGSLC